VLQFVRSGLLPEVAAIVDIHNLEVENLTFVNLRKGILLLVPTLAR
jgi:hypothetical protein